MILKGDYSNALGCSIYLVRVSYLFTVKLNT
jgi:hypothetical protein